MLRRRLQVQAVIFDYAFNSTKGALCRTFKKDFIMRVRRVTERTSHFLQAHEFRCRSIDSAARKPGADALDNFKTRPHTALEKIRVVVRTPKLFPLR